MLILGGTAWLGREAAEQFAVHGADVTCLARGAAGPAATGVDFIRGDRDHDDGLVAVRDQAWDAVIDVSRQPGQVRRAVRDLRESASKYIFVSSGSAYAGQRRLGQDEDAPLLNPLAGDVMADMSTYGEAKVACEQAVQDSFGADRSVVVRAGLIGGPGDVSGRTGFWPLRCAHPSNAEGAVLVPSAPDLPTSIIDVRDLAAWLVRLAGEQIAGIFNAVGDVHMFNEHLETARKVSGHTGPLVVADPEWLHRHGVQEWAGDASLPLWLDDPAWRGMGARRNDRAIAAGLVLRPLADTLRDTLAWEIATGIEKPRGAGLTAGDESRLLLEFKHGSRP